MRPGLLSLLLIFMLSVISMETGFSNSLHRIDRIAETKTDTIPSWLKGTFTDDYRINYTISDSLWMQKPNTRFHIIKWNLEQQYVIAKNDQANPGEGGLFTRIDFMRFKGMEPFEWGFCLTAYQAANAEAAENTPAADRTNPKKGCGGFPFSRMKRK